MTWQVEGADLVERPHLSPRAALLSRGIRLLGSSVLILLAVLVGARAWRFFVGSRTRRQIPWKPVIAVLAVLAGMLVSLSALDALTVPASLALGGLFLVNGWFNVRRGLRLLDRPVRRRARVVLLLVAAAVSTVLGIFALSTAASVSPGFVVHAGVFCLVSGLLELLLAARDRVARSRVHVDVSALWAQART